MIVDDSLMEMSSRTIIDYHAPFDRGLTFRCPVYKKKRNPNLRFVLIEKGKILSRNGRDSSVLASNTNNFSRISESHWCRIGYERPGRNHSSLAKATVPSLAVKRYRSCCFLVY